MAIAEFIKSVAPKNQEWLRLASFLSLSGLFATSALIIDANMVAPIGPETLAGLGLASTLYAIFMAALFGFGSAAQIVLARLAGNSDGRVFSKALASYLVTGIFAAFIIVPVAAFNIGFLTDWLATTSGVGFAARDYLQVIVFSIPISFGCFLMTSSLSVRKRIKEELKGFGIEVPINISLNAVLIYGLFGAPALGIVGAAYATIAALSARLVFLLVTTRSDRLFATIKGLGFSGFSNHVLEQQDETLSIALNIFLLIIGAQAYLLVFSQLPYLSFAALALLFPWVSVTNVLGRGGGLAAAIESASSVVEKSELIDELTRGARRTALLLACVFVIFVSIVLLLSWHVYIELRFGALSLVPIAALLVFVRFNSVTLASILRVDGQAGWVARTQILLQWFIGVPLALIAVVLLEQPIAVAFSILVAEEALRWWLLNRRLQTNLG